MIQTMRQPVVIRGKRHDTPSQAHHMICGLVSRSTFGRWIRNGWTSYGYSLDVARKGRHLFIPVPKVDDAKEHLTDQTVAAARRYVQNGTGELQTHRVLIIQINPGRVGVQPGSSIKKAVHTTVRTPHCECELKAKSNSPASKSEFPPPFCETHRAPSRYNQA